MIQTWVHGIWTARRELPVGRRLKPARLCSLLALFCPGNGQQHDLGAGWRRWVGRWHFGLEMPWEIGHNQQHPVTPAWQEHRVSKGLPEEDTGQSSGCLVNMVLCLWEGGCYSKGLGSQIHGISGNTLQLTTSVDDGALLTWPGCESSSSVHVLECGGSVKAVLLPSPSTPAFCPTACTLSQTPTPHPARGIPQELSVNTSPLPGNRSNFCCPGQADYLLTVNHTNYCLAQLGLFLPVMQFMWECWSSAQEFTCSCGSFHEWHFVVTQTMAVTGLCLIPPGTGALPIYSGTTWLFDAKPSLRTRNFLFSNSAPREGRCTQQTQLSGLFGQHKSKNTTPWVSTLLERGCCSFQVGRYALTQAQGGQSSSGASGIRFLPQGGNLDKKSSWAHLQH